MDNRKYKFFSLYYEKTINNGAEYYHKCLKSHFKTHHPNIWKFLERLNNVISDYDNELQRLLQGHETTRDLRNKSSKQPKEMKLKTSI